MSKLTRACIALAAFAALAVIPATASATNNPTLTAPTGTVLTPEHKKPVTISAENVGDTLMTETAAGGTTLIRCETATMSGNLETNTHSAVEGTITAAKFFGNEDKNPEPHGEECKGNAGPVLVTTNVTNGLNYCLRSTPQMGTDAFQLRGGDCTSEPRQIRFLLHVTSAFGTITCGYHRPASEPVEGTYTTHPSAAVLSVTGQRFTQDEGSFLCPNEGFLKMSFALNSGGGPVYIDDAT